MSKKSLNKPIKVNAVRLKRCCYALLCWVICLSTQAQPAMSWGEQFLSITVQECMQRVPVAFRAEGFNPDSPSVNTTFATKDIHSAYIRCLGEEDKGRTRVIIVVASNTRDENIPGGERVRLQTRMGQSGGVVGSGSSSEKWRFAIVIPQGQVYAGNYTLDLDLTDQNGNLSGTGRWADGPVSKLTGTIRNGEVVLYRVDNSTGFRGTFWGKVTANGRMEGTGQNDPLSPGGNNNSYTWTGVRMP